MRVIALLLLAGCASVRATRTLESVTIDASNESELRHIERAVSAARPALQMWGGLLYPVRLTTLASHTALEQAVNRPDHGWLRAWSRFDEILLQSPSTWVSVQSELNSLLLHELSHCLMFQHSGEPDSWRHKQIPFWFREGFALHVARQAALVPSLEDVASFIRANPTLDLFGQAETLSQAHFGPTYGMAFYALAFLQRRYGVDAPERLMALMKSGLSFGAAFEQNFGLEPAAFERDMLTFVRFRAFRSGRSLRLDRVPPEVAPR